MEDPCLRGIDASSRSPGWTSCPLPVDGRGARTDLLADIGGGAAILTPSHQYPLGRVLRPERRAAAVGMGAARRRLVIEDDYDAELRYDRQPVGALQALDREHVALVGTDEQDPRARCPARLAASLPQELVRAGRRPPRLRGRPRAGARADRFTELLLSGGFERHVRRMRSRYRGRRDRLLAMLAERAPRVRPVGIQAGLRVLLELPPGGLAAREVVVAGRRASIELDRARASPP